MIQPYNYVAIDFETTGLDLEKDEPIQVGIVKFDHNRNIVDTYESLIRPHKERKELRSIVTYLTGFSVDELLAAPTVEQVLPEIMRFLDDQTIFVGHNINFDIRVLNLMTEYEPLGFVDTLDLSKTFVHFAPSYSLDVVAEIIGDKYDLPQGSSYHQALTDSLASYKVFRYAMERFTQLRHEYMILDHMIQNNTGTIHQVIKRTPKNFKYGEKNLFLPPLQKEIKNKKRILNDKKIALDYNHLTKIDRSNRSLKDLFASLDRDQENWVFAFNQRSKMLVAQQQLQQLGINYSNLFDTRIFEAKRVNQFLQQEVFSDEETLFIAKYFSQYKMGHGLMDLNTGYDYRIFMALTTSKSIPSNLPIICTHQQLWNNSDKLNDSHTILFFDFDRWYQSFRIHEYQPFNPLWVLQMLDNILYQSEFDQDEQVYTLLTELRDRWDIFLAVLGSESDKFFIGYPDRKQEIDQIIGNPRFPKSTSLYERLMSEYQDIQDKIPPAHQEAINEMYLKAQTILNGITNVEKKMHSGDKWRYVYHQTDQYVDYADFEGAAIPGKWLLISGQADQYTNQLALTPREHPELRLSVVPKLDKLLTTLQQKSGNRYVLSTSKPVSQELFEHAIKQGFQKSYTILAENITGGVGKNCFKAAHSNKPLLIIGGNKFFFEILAQKIALDGIYVYHLLGAKKQLILQDMLWYARNLLSPSG